MTEQPRRIKVVEFPESIGDGGVETLLREYAQMIDQKKIELIILAIYIDPDSNTLQRIRDSGVRIVSLRKHFRFTVSNRLWNKLTRKFAFPYSLRKLIQEEHVDVLHMHTALLMQYAQRAIKGMHGVRLFYTCHSQPEVYFKDNATAGYHAGRYLIEHYGLRMIALYDGMARELNGRFGVDDTIVIRNGIDLPAFQNVSESLKSIRESLGIPADAFVIGHVGRLTPEKNHMFLLQTLADILQIRPEARLLLVGSGELEEQVRARADELGLAKSVTMLSHRTDIPRLLKAMDVFVLPSLYEGVPLVLVEAQAAGLRCVVSDRVNEEVFLTDKIVPLSLEAPPEIWRDTILDDTVRGTPHGRLEDYDMHREIKRLEALYMGELEP